MIRILFSLGSIVFIVAIVASGTIAFFGDNETSTGNTFAAGEIDLKIDNDSYYNGNRCTEVSTDVWEWEGDAPYPIAGTDCSTSFPASDLDDGLLFFNFNDLKPDDEGEDTISIHAGSNDAYVCMDLSVTSDDDNSSNRPELATSDIQDDPDNTWDGELGDTLEMFWWADDGDNVYEVGEASISDGVETLNELAPQGDPFSVALADSLGSVWPDNGPIPGGETRHIAKAWCFGDLTLDPVPNGDGVNPSVDPGVDCNGTLLGNETQTDGLTVDVAFRAIQARHNESFVCELQNIRIATLTVTKVVINDNGGNNSVPDFQLFADNGIVPLPVTSGIANQVSVGDYTVTENGVSGYQASFSGDCNASGQITLAPGDNKTCTITNNDLPASITLIKHVINDNGGFATENSAWGLRIDGSIVPNNSSQAVTSNVAHTIDEDGRIGYTFVDITGDPECPAALLGTATLNEGQAITCTITNDDT